MLETNSKPTLRFAGYEDSWNNKKLIELSVTGFSNGVFNDKEKVGSGYRLINVKDMYVGNSINVDQLTLLDIDKKEFENNKAKYGDIFFTRSSIVPTGIAYTNINLSDRKDLTYDGHLMKMSPNIEKVEPKFLAQYLRGHPSRKQLVSRGKVSTMTTIGQEDISSVAIRYPCLKEQQKIADFLSAVDKKTNLLKQKHKLLQQYKKGVMQQLFSQQIRFKDDNGNNFPDWEMGRVDSFVERASEAVNVEVETVYREIGIRSHGKGVFHKKPIIGKELGNKRVFWVHPNAFVVNIVFAWEHAVALTSETEKGFIASHRFPMFVPKSDRVDIKFFLLFFLSKRGKYLLELASPGGAGRNKTLGQNNFAELEVTFPCLEEQKKIRDFAQALDKKIELSAKQIELSQTFKKGLLQQMFV